MECEVCGREFEYSWKKRTTKQVCGSCMANRHRFTLKWWCVQSKGGRCQFCGYSRCLQSLDFHHLNPAEKELNIGGGNHNLPWNTIREELRKCVLVCRNCHGEVHYALEHGPKTEQAAKLLDRLDELGKAGANELRDMPKFTRRYWKLFHPKYCTYAQWTQGNVTELMLSDAQLPAFRELLNTINKSHPKPDSHSENSTLAF